MLPHTLVHKANSEPEERGTEERFPIRWLRGIADERPTERRACLEVMRGMFEDDIKMVWLQERELQNT